MNLSSNDIGIRISTRLKNLGKKQADICHEIGITKAAMSNYVNGNRVPDTTTSVRLAKALNVSIEWLLTGEENSNTLNQIEIRPEIDEKTQLENLLLQNFRDMSEDQQRQLINSSAILLSKQERTDFSKKVSSNYTNTHNEEAATELMIEINQSEIKAM